MSDMVELIALLEGATEGSRALDAEIAVKIGWRDDERYIDGGAKIMAFLRGHGHPPAQEEIGDRMGLPRYSTSVDAALSLADPDLWFNMGHRWSEPDQTKREFFAGFELPKPPYFAGARAATFPLAICIAALKALNPSPSAEKGR